MLRLMLAQQNVCCGDWRRPANATDALIHVRTVMNGEATSEKNHHMLTYS